MTCKTRDIRFRVTSEQYVKIMLVAESRGFMTVSAYLRYAALDQGRFIEEKIVEIHKAVMKK